MKDSTSLTFGCAQSSEKSYKILHLGMNDSASQVIIV